MLIASQQIDKGAVNNPRLSCMDKNIKVMHWMTPRFKVEYESRGVSID